MKVDHLNLNENDYIIYVMEMSTGIILDPFTNEYNHEGDVLYSIVHSKEELSLFIKEFSLKNRELLIFNSKSQEVDHIKVYGSIKRKWWKFW